MGVDQRCREEWSIEKLHLGMTKTELEELHPELEHFGMYGNDEHRVRNVAEGTWYRWPVDTATGRRWNYASIKGNYPNAPVVAVTVFRDFYEWNGAELRKAIDSLIDDFGPPFSRDVPLKSTRYGELYGTSKQSRKWNATTWTSEECDAMATAMYEQTRYGSTRVTLFRIALTVDPHRVSQPEEAAELDSSEERSCDQWGLGAASFETLKSRGYYRMADAEVEGRSARQRIESYITRWGPPVRDSVPVDTTRYFRAFGFPYKKQSKWRATVWEDRHCEVIATAFYRESKRLGGEMLIDAYRYPVTHFVLYLHSP